jgi:hypothetical protein
MDSPIWGMTTSVGMGEKSPEVVRCTYVCVTHGLYGDKGDIGVRLAAIPY